MTTATDLKNRTRRKERGEENPREEQTPTETNSFTLNTLSAEPVQTQSLILPPSLEQRISSPYLFTNPKIGETITTDKNTTYTITAELLAGGEGASVLAVDGEGRKKVIKLLEVPKSTTAWKELQKLNDARPLVNAALGLEMEISSLNSLRYLVISDYVEGTSAKEISEHSAFSEQETLEMLSDILEYDLGNLHDKGLAHGDAKPSNIIRLAQADALGRKYRLIDFGVVREENAELTATVTNNRRESLAYHRPEAKHCKEGDYYTLARAAYGVMMGKPPANLTSLDEEIEIEIAQRQFARLPCSEGLKELLLDMQGYGRKKYADGEEIVKELRKLQGKEVEVKEEAGLVEGKKKTGDFDTWFYYYMDGAVGAFSTLSSSAIVNYLINDHKLSNSECATSVLIGAALGIGTTGIYRGINRFKNWRKQKNEKESMEISKDISANLKEEKQIIFDAEDLNDESSVKELSELQGLEVLVREGVENEVVVQERGERRDLRGKILEKLNFVGNSLPFGVGASALLSAGVDYFFPGTSTHYIPLILGAGYGIGLLIQGRVQRMKEREQGKIFLTEKTEKETMKTNADAYLQNRPHLPPGSVIIDDNVYIPKREGQHRKMVQRKLTPSEKNLRSSERKVIEAQQIEIRERYKDITIVDVVNPLIELAFGEGWKGNYSDEKIYNGLDNPPQIFQINRLFCLGREELGGGKNIGSLSLDGSILMLENPEQWETQAQEYARLYKSLTGKKVRINAEGEAEKNIHSDQELLQAMIQQRQSHTSLEQYLRGLARVRTGLIMEMKEAMEHNHLEFGNRELRTTGAINAEQNNNFDVISYNLRWNGYKKYQESVQKIAGETRAVNYFTRPTAGGKATQVLVPLALELGKKATRQEIESGWTYFVTTRNPEKVMKECLEGGYGSGFFKKLEIGCSFSVATCIATGTLSPVLAMAGAAGMLGLMEMSYRSTPEGNKLNNAGFVFGQDQHGNYHAITAAVKPVMDLDAVLAMSKKK